MATWAFGLLCFGFFVFLFLITIIVLVARSSRRPAIRLAAGPRFCPTCGVPLPPNAPHGICPRCLLKQGLSSPAPAAAAKISPPTGPYGGPFIAPAPADLAPFFPQLEIMELLGQGGMGAVYKARQNKLDRLVALKILPSEAGRDPAFAERFNREARALARLNHPNIVSVHDFGDAGDLFYFIMEYVDGVNLRQVLQAGRLQPPDALRIIPQVCDALQYAHDEEIVHRDIKPENILIDKRGRVKIADFGLAKLLRQGLPSYTLTGSQQIMGTPHYMAPEQMEKPSTVDHRADIYSLGVVFYEMLTGELPLGRFALPSEKAAVDGRLDEIVLRTLEKDPERRYQRVSAVKTDMEALAGAAPAALPAVSPIRSFQDEVDLEMRRLQVMGPALGLAVIGILACVSWAIPAIVMFAKEWPQRPWEWEKGGLVFCIMAPLVLAASSVVLVGARRLARLESYAFVMLAAIIAMLPWSFVFPIGIGMGAWTLGLLRRPEVKLAFVRKAVHARLSGSPPAPPTGPYRGKLRSMVGAVGSLFLGSRVKHAEPLLQPTRPPISPGTKTPPPGQAFIVVEEHPSPAARVAIAARPRRGLHPALWIFGILLFVAILLVLASFVGWTTLSAHHEQEPIHNQLQREP